MRMTSKEMAVAKALLKNRVDQNNYGMLACSVLDIPMRDHMAFADAGWRISRDMRYITNNDIPMYKIKRKYKKNRELMPALEYLGGAE